jgi:hypothetical protein
MNDLSKTLSKVPSLTVIDVDTYDKDTLTHALIAVKVGKQPLYLVLDQFNLKVSHDILNLLKDICRELGVHTKIPYPLYIVCPHALSSNDFIIVKSKELITNYFRLKSKKLKKREAKLLSKVQMLSSRLGNYPTYDYIEQANQQSKQNRQLRDACVQKAFYTDTLKLISDQEKKG